MAEDKYNKESTWSQKGILGELLMAYYLRDKKRQDVLYHEDNQEKQKVGIDIEIPGFLHDGTEKIDVKMNDKVSDGVLYEYWAIFIRRNGKQIRQPFGRNAQVNWIGVVNIDYNLWLMDNKKYKKLSEEADKNKEELQLLQNKLITDLCKKLKREYKKREKSIFDAFFKDYVHSIIKYPASYIQRYGRRLLQNADSIDNGTVLRKELWLYRAKVEIMQVNWKLTAKDQRLIYLNPQFAKAFYEQIKVVEPIDTEVMTTKKGEVWTIERILGDESMQKWIFAQIKKNGIKCLWYDLKESLDYWKANHKK